MERKYLQTDLGGLGALLSSVLLNTRYLLLLHKRKRLQGVSKVPSREHFGVLSFSYDSVLELSKVLWCTVPVT